jgi:hypothetical protein
VSKNGVVQKHNFHGIQQKILQNSDFAKKRDLNPVPNGEVAADIEKMFAKNFCENHFCVEKHDFYGNLIGRPRISQKNFAKIKFSNKKHNF